MVRSLEKYQSKNELLSSLNINRKESERSVTQIIKQDNVCNEIKELICSTINISREQINTQTEIINSLRQEIDNLVTHNESLQRQLDRNRKASQEKERTLKEQQYELQKENRELKLEIRKMEIDARVATRNSQELQDRIERENASRKVQYSSGINHNSSEEVFQLQRQINELNQKIVQMKTDFDEERSMAQSKLYSVMRESNSLVRNTNDFRQNSATRTFTSFEKKIGSNNQLPNRENNYSQNSIKESSEKIKISDATVNSLVDQGVLDNIQNQQYVTIEKLRQSLAKSEKRAHLYETKFGKLKEKLYKRCKRLNDEIISIRRAFEKKMKEFFQNYTGMLKEIIFTNNKVIFSIQ